MNLARTERLAADLYRLARSRNRRHEAFLEAALAAALEEAGVWGKVRDAAAWTMLPVETPTVTPQVVGEEGRADLLLTWIGGEALVLELKPWAPPDDLQLGKYERDHPRAFVSAVAQWRAPVQGERRLRMLTWGVLRGIGWEGEPVAWRQLRALIAAVGADMGNLDKSAVQGLIPTWPAWDVIERWVRAGLPRVHRVFGAAGWSLVDRDAGRRRPGMEVNHQRFGLYLWPPDVSEASAFYVFLGVYLGHDGRAVLREGTPDLRLMVQLNPNAAAQGALWARPGFADAVSRWEGDVGALRRQASRDVWYLLDAREPLKALLERPDQGAAFADWAEARAREVVDAGLVEHLLTVR